MRSRSRPRCGSARAPSRSASRARAPRSSAPPPARLARPRASLERRRTDPRCALTLLAGGDVAFTAHARATIAQDPMAVASSVVAVVLDVDDVQDHADPRFTIQGPAAWRWGDAQAAARAPRIPGRLAG